LQLHVNSFLGREPRARERNLSPTRIFLTGATGFIGGHLLRALVESTLLLFLIKNRLGPTLLLLLAMDAVALSLRAILSLHWRLALYSGLALHLVMGFGAILASDGVIHGTLLLLLGDRYRCRYARLAACFRGQGPLEIVGAGLLAGGGEELFFRGLLLEALRSRAGASPAVSVGISALVFGALHLLPDPRLAPFALWAAVQGAILGCLYITTGSLLVPMLVHGMHDVLGFVMFAWQRRLDGRADPERARKHEGSESAKG
jgi:membrane protease YdiL (CAAX protease family)